MLVKILGESVNVRLKKKENSLFEKPFRENNQKRQLEFMYWLIDYRSGGLLTTELIRMKHWDLFEQGVTYYDRKSSEVKFEEFEKK